MQIVDLSSQPPEMREAAALMLVEQFVEPRGWPDAESAREEVANLLNEGFAFAMLVDSTVAGWIGGLPEYQGRVWELHPLVVHRDYRNRGIGRELVQRFEVEVARRGAFTILLGTDDDSGMTSLSDVDLYVGTAEHIRNVRDLGRQHPFGFYQKLGYTITGVIPDANGLGRPDIFMAKRVRPERPHRP